MELGIQTMTGYPDTLALAQWCETNGIAALAVADHYLAGDDVSIPAYDQLVILGAVAAQTNRLELSTLVSPLTFRHPAVHYKAAVTLDEISEGRFTMGLGTGWMEREHEAFGLELHEMSERFDRLEETLAYFAAARSGDGFTGEHYRIEAFVPQPAPTNLRIVVGGSGTRKTPALAGRFADEFNVFPSESGISQRVSAARQAAASSGRSVDSLMISTAFPVFVGRDESSYRDAVTRTAEARGHDPDALEERARSLGIPHGSPEMFRSGLARLAAEGIERVYLQVGVEPGESIEQASLVAEIISGM